MGLNDRYFVFIKSDQGGIYDPTHKYIEEVETTDELWDVLDKIESNYDLTLIAVMKGDLITGNVLRARRDTANRDKILGLTEEEVNWVF